ncbi:hypothetical protein [Bdellovibrio sp. ArHS]|uniref:hypothetical protein n=1 Tax=Bdellovibrio sp. ArHS TaxID=1569284 RepID=UPI0025C408F9|nr:hypothetical protein [Bdellovibrio sp. ArHS]
MEESISLLFLFASKKKKRETKTTSGIKINSRLRSFSPSSIGAPFFKDGDPTIKKLSPIKAKPLVYSNLLNNNPNEMGLTEQSAMTALC